MLNQTFHFSTIREDRIRNIFFISFNHYKFILVLDEDIYVFPLLDLEIHQYQSNPRKL